MAQLTLRASTRWLHQRTLEGLVDEFGGDADGIQITQIQLETHLRGRCAHTSPATHNRHLAIISSLLSSCEDQELIVRSPADRIGRRKPRMTRTAERQSWAIAHMELEACWASAGIPLRERVFVAYDTAARVSELLNLDIVDSTAPTNKPEIPKAPHDLKQRSPEDHEVLWRW